LFLELVRKVGEKDPDLARAALAGLRAYQDAPAAPKPQPRPAVASVQGATLRDHGGDGPPVVLIPSLINPPRILDLDPDVSLAAAIASMGWRPLLLDWGEAGPRKALGVADHVAQLLQPLLSTLDQRPVLIGYCLGGTMAIAATDHAPIAGLVTLATPWDFGAYPPDARNALADLWARAEPSARALGLLPIEVLQAAFWSLDEQRTVRKFARFADLDPESPEAQRFVALEEWANEGEALPFAAARELMEDLFAANASGNGRWMVADKAAAVPADVPVLHLTAHDDRIAPAATAPPGPRLQIPSGHVGMIVGSARSRLHEAIRAFLAQLVP
jgi:polyhydroxyalkanoate synthase subunit PhaC